jgi:PAS domain S-box-containing protein
MFNFTVQNPYSFLIAFIPALFSFTILIYILFALPRNRITNVFALLTFACVLWQIADSLQRVAATPEDADFWDSLLCISWIFIGALCMHFALLYTQRLKGNYARFYVPFLYGPGFLFYALYLMHFYKHVFQPLPFWGWGNFHNQHPLDIALVYWISTLVIAAMALLIIYTAQIKNDKLLKKQSLLISVGIGIPALTGIVTQVIFPTVFQIAPVPVTSTFMVFLSIATFIALKKYKLFSVSDLVQNEILIDSMPIIVFSISTEKRIIYMNNTAVTTFGLDKNKISEMELKKLFSFESLEEESRLNLLCDAALNGGKISNADFSFNTPQGKIDVILSCNPVINNNHVRGVLVAARDITELKRSHELIKKRELMLEEAQKLSHIGSWEWEIETDTVTWSDELYRIYGYEPGKEIITYEKYLADIHPDETDQIVAIIRQAYADHQPFSFYHKIKRKNGGEVSVYAQGQVLVDENNKVVKMSGTTQDITELQRKEEMLERQNLELQKINAELDKFVYSVSHDLRAPLTSMLGLVEISEDETEDINMQERLHLLKGSIKKLDNFILDILDHSRNARMEIQNEEIDFYKIANDVTENLKYRGQYDKHAVDIRANIKTNGCFKSDKNRIAIVLGNLVSNAIKYSNPNVCTPLVEIDVTADEKEANIVVRDNGIGIDKIYHDKIFEMFYRVSNNSIGSGLGLYLVKESLKKLNGTITVQSQKGKGSLFHVSIPNNQTL